MRGITGYQPSPGSASLSAKFSEDTQESEQMPDQTLKTRIVSWLTTYNFRLLLQRASYFQGPDSVKPGTGGFILPGKKPVSAR